MAYKKCTNAKGVRKKGMMKFLHLGIKTKNPASSPAKYWERNNRDCTTKIVK
jgi:hypothetical protein